MKYESSRSTQYKSTSSQQDAALA